MTDDVEATLASLERRLHALQAELDAEEGPLRTPLGPPPEEAAPRLATDPLDRFGAELRRLVDVWDQTVVALRTEAAESLTFSGDVAIEAHGDLRGLCALDRALRDVPGVTALKLRAYAEGAAALEVGLDRDVALVAELRRTLSFELLSVAAGRLTLSLS